MPDSDLMFRPASELASMVRESEISSRELVEISLERIAELNPQVNAFVDVDAEGALDAADRVAPAISGRSPACRSRSRTTARCEACV